jgi:hypothetical protein
VQPSFAAHELEARVGETGIVVPPAKIERERLRRFPLALAGPPKRDPLGLAIGSDGGCVAAPVDEQREAVTAGRRGRPSSVHQHRGQRRGHRVLSCWQRAGAVDVRVQRERTARAAIGRGGTVGARSRDSAVGSLIGCRGRIRSRAGRTRVGPRVGLGRQGRVFAPDQEETNRHQARDCYGSLHAG